MYLSVFKQFNKIAGNRTFPEIIKAIRSNRLRNEILELRKILNDGDEKEYSRRKKALIAFTPSGRFEGGRKLEYLKEYSGIIVLDIDKLNDRTVKLKETVKTCPFTYACFVSPGGNGLKVFVRISLGMEHHVEEFNRIKTYYERLIQFKVDPSGKDITRLCFFSHDEDAYLNEDSWVFEAKATEDTDDVEQEFLRQVQFTENILTYEPGSRNNFIYQLACNCKRAGLSKQDTINHMKKAYDLDPSEIKSSVSSAFGNNSQDFEEIKDKEDKKHTSNKFTITEEYLNDKYIIRYNVVSNKFEYKGKTEERYKELNENNLYVKLQKSNINISLNNLVALLKSDFVNEHNPFIEYFKSLPQWDGQTDHINKLASFLSTPDDERLKKHFKKWIVRMVRTAIDENYYNKQAFILVGSKQNSGKSTFCRFLCPPTLSDYIVENIGTDKDSLIAITENMLINLDELSTADKAEINIFKSMFSKDKVKARLTYDRRPSVHVRRASFVGSTDRWEFLTDENGSVRWLCFDIRHIDWKYTKQVDINKVYSQAYHLLLHTRFEYDLSIDEIEENERINKRYQVSSVERDLVQRFFRPAKKDEGSFMTPTDILEKITRHTTMRVSNVQLGRELKFLGFERYAKFVDGNARYGYWVKEISDSIEK